MSPAFDQHSSPALRDYVARAGSRDELAQLLTGHDLRGFTPDFIEVDASGWQQRQHSLSSLVRSEAITYGGSSGSHVAKPWSLDVVPFIMSSAEWTKLQAGLRQRAELLNAILADLYGPRRLLHSGVLPSELVLAHSGFLPAADGITLPGHHQLTVVATDLIRGGDGSWTAISDRTGSPSGLGYAMANRRMVARVLDDDYRHVPIHRLRGFFDQLRVALEDTLPEQSDSPRVVILSSGTTAETAYDQALVAMLVGYPIAQPGDLEIIDGHLRLRTIGRGRPVNIVHRRLDAEYADSLDLRSDSLLGIPGLLQATRRHRVSVANHLGSGVLENSGLLAYIDRIAHFLLGESLKLATAPTWWCGDPDGLSYVTSHLDSLIIKPISSTTEMHAIPVWLLDDHGRSEMLAKIATEPWRWTAQRYLEPSTVPVVEGGSLRPHPMVLRTFGVADGVSYSFMPGGLARVASTTGQWNITNSSGASSKDVWVLESDRQEPRRAQPSALRPVRAAPAATAVGLPPSAAENLYWLGRYAERAEMTSRVLKVSEQLIADNLDRPDTPGHSAMLTMVRALSVIAGIPSDSAGEGSDEQLDRLLPYVRRLLVDQTSRGAVAHAVDHMSVCAANARALLSGDTFAILDALNAVLRTARRDEDLCAVQPVINEALRSMLAFAGVANESLVRDTTWAFVEAGRRVERAQITVQLLRQTVAWVTGPITEATLSESVLEAGDSVITYHRRLAAGVGALVPAEATLELLLLDAANPRSVRYQLDKLVQALAFAPAAQVDEAANALVSAVRQVGPSQLAGSEREPARVLLDQLDSGLRGLSELIEQAHFPAQPPAIWFAVPERSEDSYGY